MAMPNNAPESRPPNPRSASAKTSRSHRSASTSRPTTVTAMWTARWRTGSKAARAAPGAAAPDGRPSTAFRTRQSTMSTRGSATSRRTLRMGARDTGGPSVRSSATRARKMIARYAVARIGHSSARSRRSGLPSPAPRISVPVQPAVLDHEVELDGATLFPRARAARAGPVFAAPLAEEAAGQPDRHEPEAHHARGPPCAHPRHLLVAPAEFDVVPPKIVHELVAALQTGARHEPRSPKTTRSSSSSVPG